MASDTITVAIRGAFGNGQPQRAEKVGMFKKLRCTEIAVSAVIAILLVAFLAKRIF